MNETQRSEEADLGNLRNRARRDELILEHMPLVADIAANFQSIPVHVELDDLIQAGVRGLFDAAGKYRDDEEVAFSTYAKHRIRGAILDTLRELESSRSVIERYGHVQRVTLELTADSSARRLTLRLPIKLVSLPVACSR
jgi:RNA polymerase sigma factor FliA